MSYQPALFAYAVTPTVVPYTTDPNHPTPVTLMITVNNPTPKFVDCPQLVFTIPTGTGAGAITNNPAKITPSPALGVPWTITSDKAGNLTAIPNPGTSGLGVGDSIAFLITNIDINDLPGLAVIDVWEGLDPRYTNLDVSKTPPGLAITSFTANPIQISAGDTTTLSWTTTGAQTCTLSWQGNTKTNLKTDGELPVTPEITTTYTLTATNTPRTNRPRTNTNHDRTSAGTSVTQQITVYVPQVTILSFGASPRQVAQDGPTTLSWLVNNATSCTVTPGDTAVDPVSGTLVVHPHLSGSYDLSASGFGRVVSMPAPVTVMPVEVGPFTATPSQLPPGATLSSTLQWSTTWATSCSIETVGSVPVSGSHQVAPAATTTYNLQPVGLNPPASAVTVTVCPAITSLEVMTYPRSNQLVVLYQTVGGTVTATVGQSPPMSYPATGGIYLNTPVAVALTVNGLGLASSVTIEASDAVGVQVNSLSLTCGYSVNAPGATASLSWDIDGGQPTGSIAAAAAGEIAGATGSIAFDIGPGPNTGNNTWELTLHLTSDISPDGPSILMSGALPIPVSSHTDSHSPGPPPIPQSPEEDT
jgi:hypothetical protein